MRIAAISDTHGYQPDIPDCDLLIHAGDITAFDDYAGAEEWRRQMQWLGTNSAFATILVPGNHDWITQYDPIYATNVAADFGVTLLLGERFYANGLHIIGAPWCPPFGTWAHNVPKDVLETQWGRLLDSPLRPTDILVTHSPPYGRGDQAFSSGDHLGCISLRRTLEDNNPGLHIFGHIHGGRGSDALGRWHNVSYLDETMRPHSLSPFLEIEFEEKED